MKNTKEISKIPIWIELELSYKDYVQFYRSTSLVRLSRIVMYLVFFVISILLVVDIIVLYLGVSGDSHSSFIINLLYFFLVLTLFNYLSLLPRRNYDSNALAREKKRYTFFDDRVEIKYESSGSFVLTWDKFYKVVFSKNFVCLFTSIQTGHIISTERFTDAEYKSLQSLLLKQMPSGKIKLQNIKLPKKEDGQPTQKG